MTDAIENAEDILLDSLEIFGVERTDDPGCIQYGDLVLTVAPKMRWHLLMGMKMRDVLLRLVDTHTDDLDGKANTLLADHLFSPALFLAERIERGLIEVSGRSSESV
ncbi:hypothetical protein ID866_5158 [Astraeus odoratus]|nr:hypothetical protein ID866_5158 [Astraeus odoratus]